MTTIPEKQLSPELIDALEDLIKSENRPIKLNSGGQNFVLLKEQDYRGWIETAYLLSSKKNAKILQDALDEPLDECKDLKAVLNDLDS